MYTLPHDTSVLFSPVRLAGRTVLELGAGTGAFPACLFANTAWALPNAPPMQWIASDRKENIPLLEKNLATLVKNSAAQVHVEELDWFEVQHGSPASRKQLVRDILRPLSRSDSDQDPVLDLVLCIDCVYNPGLHDALLATMDAFCAPHHTAVLVAIQLREAENTRQFLSSWAERGHYTIYGLEDDMLPAPMRCGYAAWIAWRTGAPVEKGVRPTSRK